jgi:hypothetical protein
MKNFLARREKGKSLLKVELQKIGGSVQRKQIPIT